MDVPDGQGGSGRSGRGNLVGCPGACEAAAGRVRGPRSESQAPEVAGGFECGEYYLGL